MRQDIIDYINELQNDREGIYPYRIIEKVVSQFNVSVDCASYYVIMHIQNEIERALD